MEELEKKEIEIKNRLEDIDNNRKIEEEFLNNLTDEEYLNYLKSSYRKIKNVLNDGDFTVIEGGE